jgi:hypothetical protein
MSDYKGETPEFWIKKAVQDLSNANPGIPPTVLTEKVNELMDALGVEHSSENRDS